MGRDSGEGQGPRFVGPRNAPTAMDSPPPRWLVMLLSIIATIAAIPAGIIAALAIISIILRL